ncbi:Peter Pan-like protein [Camellia lanceoleosa]|uniref:Peter Pan-like protein n=1 Tax=Camellia lanceoleosa TaxID=1840588 RepID=A0ACC0FVZ0_9ERIC|nr:Peter Pan-like protein [Camellia lanceoleosa]
MIVLGKASDNRVEREFKALAKMEKKPNNIIDFLNIARPMGVTHFLMLSKTATAPYLRVARTPQGPILTFKIQEYSLAVVVAQSQAKLSSCQRIVLLNYNETKLIDFWHYSIRLQPVPDLRKFVQNHQVPDLSLQDVSDFVTKAGYGSESKADEEAATISLASDLGRFNQVSTKSAVTLQEIGPRLTLHLIKIEEGLCSGGVIFGEYENRGGKKTQQEEEEEDEEEVEEEMVED